MIIHRLQSTTSRIILRGGTRIYFMRRSLSQIMGVGQDADSEGNCLESLQLETRLADDDE